MFVDIVARWDDEDCKDSDEHPYANDIVAFAVLFWGIFPAQTSDFIHWGLVLYLFIELIHCWWYRRSARIIIWSIKCMRDGWFNHRLKMYHWSVFTYIYLLKNQFCVFTSPLSVFSFFSHSWANFPALPRENHFDHPLLRITVHFTHREEWSKPSLFLRVKSISDIT